MPTVLMIVRVGIRSPLDSVTSLGVAKATRVFVRTSTPSSSTRSRGELDEAREGLGAGAVVAAELRAGSSGPGWTSTKRHSA